MLQAAQDLYFESKEETLKMHGEDPNRAGSEYKCVIACRARRGIRLCSHDILATSPCNCRCGLNQLLVPGTCVWSYAGHFQLETSLLQGCHGSLCPNLSLWAPLTYKGNKLTQYFPVPTSSHSAFLVLGPSLLLHSKPAPLVREPLRTKDGNLGGATWQIMERDCERGL